MPTLSANVLTRFVTSIFQKAGVSESEARLVSLSLVGSNLRGHDSHGVMRVPQYVGFLERGEYRSGVELRVEHESPAVLVCDGQWGFGQVQAHRLLDRLIPRAQSLGLAAGTARNTGHIGRLGEYAERAADSGLILIATVNNCGAGQRVAPPGGVEPRLGTNPLCVAVPTAGDPVVLDFGTSVVAEGKVRVYQINNRPVPEGWLLDREGLPTTDPSVLYQPPLGSIRPMGGAQAYKGFGLALVLDMLAGGLSGGRTSYPDAPPARGNNVVFLAFDPERFAGRDALLRESTQLVDYVRGATPVQAGGTITLPGDPERSTLARRSVEGIPLEEAHWAKLVELADKLGAPVPPLSGEEDRFP
ncbi:MAG: malate/lactate/ureidoglycolate dehydrogenase [Isosphaeraceae bacterium]